ncbi:sensor histidine kinase [Actinoplanes sp. RD1]|uniref:sensor histidine kinase n=1 Tax=Actinoplanes sp. RD1 TaxID=3064538 RepID=UPI002740D293|nr:histidine kinase [Actinoplanes sp. RD1]
MNPRPLWQSRSLPIAVAAAVTAVLLVCATGTPGSGGRWVVPLLGGAAVAVAVWAVLRRRAERAAYERRLTAWAATEAVLGERLRIARDLHDLVSHGLGLITVRAAATRGLPQSPQVRAAFADIEQASRHATDELRRMLTVLRERDTAAPRTPVDDVGALPAVVQLARRGGLRPRLSVGELGVVPAGVQVAVGAVVREGLANAARHAGPVAVEVRVCREGGELVVTVADEGPAAGRPAAAPGTGHGLAGLRERVGSLGGTVTACPTGTGFRLTARIPA